MFLFWPFCEPALIFPKPLINHRCQWWAIHSMAMVGFGQKHWKNHWYQWLKKMDLGLNDKDKCIKILSIFIDDDKSQWWHKHPMMMTIIDDMINIQSVNICKARLHLKFGFWFCRHQIEVVDGYSMGELISNKIKGRRKKRIFYG